MGKVVITGSNGFIGSSLVNRLKDQFDFQMLAFEDLTKEETIRDSLIATPTLIHLAGMSSVSECEKNVNEAYKANVGLTCALADIFYRNNRRGHFIFASTGQVYDVNEPVPHSEQTKIQPGNVYARTKLCAELALTELAKLYQGRLTILRLYNHTHKSQSNRFVLPSIFKQITESNSNVVRIKVGNIEVERDFSAIQDLVNAFRLLLTDNQNSQAIDIYNLGSGSGKSLYTLILDLANRFQKKIEFELDPSLMRTNEPKKIYCDSTKFKKHFLWDSRSSNSDAFLDLFLEDLK